MSMTDLSGFEAPYGRKTQRASEVHILWIAAGPSVPIRNLRKIANATLHREPGWRRKGATRSA